MIVGNIPTQKRRSGGRMLPLLLSLLFLSGAGCGKTSYEFRSEAPPPTLPVSAADQNQAQKHVEQFISHVKRKDYAAVRQMMAPSLRARTPATFPQWLEQERLQPLMESRDWQYPLIEHLARGKKLVVRARFIGADGGLYRTNFGFLKQGEDWQIELLLPPTQPKSPVQNSGKSTSPGQ
jgi:hypothetical protein